MVEVDTRATRGNRKDPAASSGSTGPVSSASTAGAAVAGALGASGAHIPATPGPIPGPATILTLNRLGALCPHAERKAGILDALLHHAPEHGINTPARLAMFLAQVGHESAGLTRWEESFAYSVERLLVVFPRHFSTLEQAAKYVARGREAIANHVYANRMGNGSESSGDGWRYRGRGPIQLTGWSNYRRFGVLTGLDLLANPDLVARVDEGVLVACAYFEHAECAAFADRGDIAGCTRAINGGQNGLIDRARRWEDAKRVLGVAA